MPGVAVTCGGTPSISSTPPSWWPASIGLLFGHRRFVLLLGHPEPIVFEIGGQSRGGGGSKVSDVAAHSADGSHSGLFRYSVQFGSGLVDLVGCVRHHGGGRHRLALAGRVEQ